VWDLLGQDLSNKDWVTKLFTYSIDFHILIIHRRCPNYLYEMNLYVYFHKIYIKITIILKYDIFFLCLVDLVMIKTKPSNGKNKFSNTCNKKY